MMEPDGLYESPRLNVLDHPNVEDGESVSKVGELRLNSNSTSLQSRDGAAYFEYLSIHFDWTTTLPGAPYRSLDLIVVRRENEDGEIAPCAPFVEKGKVPKEPRTVGSEGDKLYSMTSATSDIEKIIEKKLTSLDDPYFVPFSNVESKDASAILRSARSGDGFFDMCNKAWGSISRAEMQKEWLFSFNEDGLKNFNYESTLCEYNNEHAGMQYPKEWQNEDILPIREDGIIAKSEIQEPIRISREDQVRKLKKLAKRLSKLRDSDKQSGAEESLFSQLAFFTDSMRAAQDALDECCKRPVGTKVKTSAYKDYLMCLEPEDVFGPRPSQGMLELVNAEKARFLAVQEEHDYASLSIPQEVMDRYITAGAKVYRPSTYLEGELKAMDEDSARKHLRDFYAAHNRNVAAFCELMTPEKKEYTKYKGSLPNYAPRLLSDSLIYQAISMRVLIEGELAAMRHELYSVDDLVPVKECLIARGSKDGWKAIEALQKELDDYNLQHLDKINEKIAKRVIKANEKLEYQPSDLDLKEWNTRSVKRRVRLNNENGVPHNLKYGKWFFGKIHSFKGNIACSPVAGTPVLPSKNPINSEAALQFAFLSNNDLGYTLHNTHTVSNTYEGCTALFDLAKGAVVLSASVGPDTLQKRVSLPRALHDASKVTNLALRWTCKSNDYLEEEGGI